MKSYKIYQLDKNHEEYLFRRYNDKVSPKKSWYNEVYAGEIEPKVDVIATLEELYFIFNMRHPADFKGHSLSVSDVVLLDGKYYYCDSFGYKELTNFENE